MLYNIAWWADHIFPGLLFFFILVYSCRIESQTQDILCRAVPKNMLKTCPVNKNYMPLSLAWDLSVENGQSRHRITFKHLLDFFHRCFKGMVTKSWTEVFVCEIATKKSSVEMHTILSAQVNSSSWETPPYSPQSELTKTRKKSIKTSF